MERKVNPQRINDYADYVGKSRTLSGFQYHAFRSIGVNYFPQTLFGPTDDMGTATFIDSHSSEGTDINNYNEMVGASHMPGGQYRAAYKAPYTRKHEGWFDLGVLGEGTPYAGTLSTAKAINNQGLIVGWSFLKVGSGQTWRAFVCSNEGDPGSQPMLNLTEHSWVFTGGQWQRADVNGWVLTSAEAVNEANWIVGYGYKGGKTQAFLLSPR